MQALHVRCARGRLAGATARAAANTGRRYRRLFVDISVIAADDAGTGIQRIARAVALHLLFHPLPGWTVHPVAVSRFGYHIASWPADTAGRDEAARCERVSAHPGDVFFGLDLSLHSVYRHRRQLADFKRQGGTLWFMMHDVLPLQRPDWFVDGSAMQFARWLRVLAVLADGFFCNSGYTREQLRAELDARFGLRNGFEARVLPMGWDVSGSRPSTGLPDGFEASLESMAAHPIILMVGTLEPRKGHADVLAAFARLWGEGSRARLAIVGRQGWKTQDLCAAIRNHPQLGERLFWFDDASDELLSRLYEACRGVIVASHAEGFGLPLIEALGHGKPVLARDLPVFRAHEGRGVRFFDAGIDEAGLAAAIRAWLGEPAAPAAQLPIPVWADTASAVFAGLNGAPDSLLVV
jgi:glycosyltransferase involved in cell wall biosynthesis